jgi:NhaP-type Na+/H+ or K+/H+ antiporter
MVQSNEMLALLLQPATPIVVKMAGERPKDIGVIDIIFGSLGITAMFLVGACVLGVLLGFAFIWVRKRMDANQPVHAPSSAYGFTPSTVAREKDQA